MCQTQVLTEGRGREPYQRHQCYDSGTTEEEDTKTAGQALEGFLVLRVSEEDTERHNGGRDHEEKHEMNKEIIHVASLAVALERSLTGSALIPLSALRSPQP